MKNFAFFVSSLCMLFSCNRKGELKTVTSGNNYALTIPSFLKKAEGLNPSASMEYRHLFKEMYLIGIDEEKAVAKAAIEKHGLTDSYSSDLEGYAKMMLDNYRNSMAHPVIYDEVNTYVNGIPAKLAKIKGKFDGIEVYYTAGFYESNTHFYQVIVWTINYHRDGYQDIMQNILESFTVLNE